MAGTCPTELPLGSLGVLQQPWEEEGRSSPCLSTSGSPAQEYLKQRGLLEETEIFPSSLAFPAPGEGCTNTPGPGSVRKEV